jgi:hypothetical protein
MSSDNLSSIRVVETAPIVRRMRILFIVEGHIAGTWMPRQRAPGRQVRGISSCWLQMEGRRQLAINHQSEIKSATHLRHGGGFVTTSQAFDFPYLQRDHPRTTAGNMSQDF